MLILMLPLFGLTSTAAKVAIAIAIGTVAGLAVLLLHRAGLFQSISRDTITASETCAAGTSLRSTPVKRAFWHDRERRQAFASTSLTMTLFLTKWLALAFMLAGGITSLPAAMAVFSLVRPPIFGCYLMAGWIGAISAGCVFEFV
ncbi:MAG: hypothetical protein HKN60_07760 [Rhizobiales bacterium]|nr:hypothetical protein [Hyphomicrobiales bacterium]